MSMRRSAAAVVNVSRQAVKIGNKVVPLSMPEDLQEELRHAPVLPGVAGGKWTPSVRMHAMEFFWANKIRYDRLSDMRKRRLREMFVYMAFVGIFTYVATVSRDTSTSHFYVTGMRNYFELTGMSAAEVPNGDKDFFGIGMYGDVSSWIRSVLLPRLRPNGDTDAHGNPTPKTVLGSNIIIGDVVMRQVRIKPQSCKTPLSVYSRNATCYPDYSPSIEQTTTPQAWIDGYIAAGGSNTTFPDWFNWQPSKGGNYANSQVRTSYGTSGFTYTFDLSNVTKCVNDIFMMDAINWYDWLQTRALFIEFTLYNPNVNKFVTAFFLIENSKEGGGLLPTTTYRVVNLYRFARTSSLIDLCVEGAMFVFAFFFVFVELVHMRNEGRLYWIVTYNYLSLLNLTIFVIVFLLELYTILTSRTLFATSTIDDIDDHELHMLAYYTYQSYNLNAFNALLTWLRLTKYLDLLSGKTRQLSVTLGRSAGDVFIVLLIFIVIYFGYSLAFHLAFGQDLPDFAYVDSSMIAMFLTLLGAFSFDSLRTSNRILGPILFVSYILVMVFCILNMFLTVVMKAYDKVSEELAREPDELPSHIRKEIFRKIKAFFYRKKATAKVAPSVRRKAILPTTASVSNTEVKDINEGEEEEEIDAENQYLNDKELEEIFMAEKDRLARLEIHSVEYMKKIADVDLDGEVSVAEIMNFKKKLNEGEEEEEEEEEMHLIMKVLERTNQIVQEQRALLTLIQSQGVIPSSNMNMTSKGSTAQPAVGSRGGIQAAALSGLFTSARFGPPANANGAFPAPNSGTRK